MCKISLAKKTLFFFILSVIFIIMLTSCSGRHQVQLPDGMVPFKDLAKKMEFQLPAGWKQAPVDPEIKKITRGIRLGDPTGFQKGDRGTLAVWCDDYNPSRSNLQHMLDVINEYAPVHKGAGIYFEVESPGSGYISRPHVMGYKATHVVKGERHEFLIVTVHKTQGTGGLDRAVRGQAGGCDYMLFGRSTTNEFSDEILKDITEIAATLIHPED